MAQDPTLCTATAESDIVTDSEMEMGGNDDWQDNDVESTNDDPSNSTFIKKSNDCIRLICISDTHNMHRGLTKRLEELYESPTDVLLHAGDFTERGTKREISDVDKWFGELPYKHIYVISGNMDGLTLDNGGMNGDEEITNAVYLQHELQYIEFPELDDFKLSIFGSPYTPQFYGGFQIANKRQGKKLWQQVPDNVDILMTHGPPKGILDVTSHGRSVGDVALRDQVLDRIKPKLMIFGHVHPSHGKEYQKQDGITFANVAMHDNLKGMDKAQYHNPIVYKFPINRKNKNNP